MGSLNLIIYATPLIVFIYCICDLVVTKRTSRKLSSHPVVGNPWALTPRVLSNLIYATTASQLLERGYQKFKGKVFQIVRGDGNVVVLPLSLLEQLSALPSKIASPHEALEHDLLGSYTGLNTILESRLHHTIVQRKLTPKLGALTPHLEDELSASFHDYVPQCNEWTEIKPFKVLGKVAARLSARALVGPKFCRHPSWLGLSINYTENLFKTIVILRLFPAWTHPLLSRMLPSYWAGKAYVKSAKSILGSQLNEMLRKNDDGLWTPGSSEDDYNVLAWLADTAKGIDRDSNALAHVEVLLSLAAVHTTLLRMVNVLYDLTAHPEYFGELEGEITDTVSDGWDKSSYYKLRKLDSFLRESQRRSPPTILGMKRVFRKDFTFADGLTISKGTYVCMPTFAIENDPLHTVDPKSFDGFRSYRIRQQEGEINDHQFSSIERTVLNFGHGVSACPGRFFASLIIKMVFVKLLTEYEFKFLPGTGRPKNMIVHEFLFPLPWDKILIKRKEIGTCPF